MLQKYARNVSILSMAAGLCILVLAAGCSDSGTIPQTEVSVSALPPEAQVAVDVQNGNLDMVKFAIDANPAFLQFRGSRDMTLLHIAAANGQRAVADYLMEKGLSPAASTDDGYTPGDLAFEFGFNDLGNYLKQFEAAAQP